MYRRFLLLFLILSIFTGCDNKQPYIEPTPISTTQPSINPINNNIIIEDVYKIEFGPSSKGILSFGPSSKGVSSLFGPSSKGITNFNIDVNLPDTIVRNDISTFKVASVSENNLKIEHFKIQVLKEDKIIAEIKVLPIQKNIKIGMSAEPSLYKLQVIAEGNFESLEMSGTFINVKQDYISDVNVNLYAKIPSKAMLDIEVSARNRKFLSEDNVSNLEIPNNQINTNSTNN